MHGRAGRGVGGWRFSPDLLPLAPHVQARPGHDRPLRVRVFLHLFRVFEPSTRGLTDRSIDLVLSPPLVSSPLHTVVWSGLPSPHTKQVKYRGICCVLSRALLSSCRCCRALCVRPSWGSKRNRYNIVVRPEEMVFQYNMLLTARACHIRWMPRMPVLSDRYIRLCAKYHSVGTFHHRSLQTRLALCSLFGPPREQQQQRSCTIKRPERKARRDLEQEQLKR